MDQLTELITAFKIPVGQWGKSFFALLTQHLEWFFDSIARGLTVVLELLMDGLLMVPPLVLIALFAGLAYLLQRNWKLALGTALGLLFILNQGLWKETVETLVQLVTEVSDLKDQKEAAAKEALVSVAEATEVKEEETEVVLENHLVKEKEVVFKI